MGQELSVDILRSFLGFNRCLGLTQVLFWSRRQRHWVADLSIWLAVAPSFPWARSHNFQLEQQPAFQESFDTAVLWTTLLHVPKVDQASVLSEVKIA